MAARKQRRRGNGKGEKELQQPTGGGEEGSGGEEGRGEEMVAQMAADGMGREEERLRGRVAARKAVCGEEE